MVGSWLPSAHWLVSNITLTLSFALILLNWRLPILRNLALVNFIVGLAGLQLITNMDSFPLQNTRIFEYLAAATVNWGKVLFILFLVGSDIKYLCKTSMQLTAIFLLLGCMNMACFIDHLVFNGGQDGDFLATSYTVISPALNALALLVLALPFVLSQLVKKQSTNHRSSY